MLNRFKKQYQTLQAPVKASLWFLICGFLQKGISFITSPIFTRIMTETEYGRFSAYNSWLGIVQIIVSLNLAAGVYTRGLVKNEGDQDRFSSSLLGLSTICILFFSVVYAIFHSLVNRWLDLTTLMMAAMLLDIWAQAAYQFWANRERVNYRYKKLVALTMAYVILRPTLGIFCVLQTDTAHQMEARVLATTFVNFALFAGLYISICRKGKQFFHKKYWTYALKFNLPLVPHYLAQIVLNQSDRLMIKNLCGTAETAYYTVAYNIAMVLQIFNNSVSGTLNPWIYKAIKNDETDKISEVSYLVLALIALLNLAVVLVAPELLRIMAPESYAVAVWVIPPVTISVYFMFLYNLFATFEYYFEKTHYVTIATVVGAVLNIILNAIFIPKFGFVAAGYTTLVCYIFYAFAHYFFMRKVCNRHMSGKKIYDWRMIVAFGLGLLVCSFAVMMLYNAPWVRYGLLLILLLAGVWKRKEIVGLLGMLRNKEI